MSSALVIGLVVLGLSSITSLGVSVVTLLRMGAGKDGQRKIEPTEMHAVVTELRSQTVTLNKLDRESGETRAGVEAVTRRIEELRTDQRKDMEGVHSRIGGISRELSATTAKVEIALKNSERA